MNYKMILLSVSMAAFTVLGGVAHATSGGEPAGPIGGSDVGAAYLPPSGLYGAVIGMNLSGNEYKGDNQEKSPFNPNSMFRIVEGGVALLYVYPMQLAGGSLASSFVYGVQHQHIRLGLPGGNVIFDSDTNGGADIYSDLLIWSRYVGHLGSYAPSNFHSAYPYPLPYGLTVAPALSMQFPTGSYHNNSEPSIGHNYYVFVPNIALTYLMPPVTRWDEGVEISTRFYYDISTQNHSNGYRSGDVFALDWALTDRIKLWKIGVAGSYGQQVTDDIQHKEPAYGTGNWFRMMAIGPVIYRDLPAINGFAKFKLTFEPVCRNGYPVTAAVFVIGKKF